MRIHGSNTVGAKLCPEIAKQFFSPQGYPQIKSEHGGKENALAVFARKDGRVHRIEIKAHGSSTGFVSLESDQCDTAMDRGEPLEPVTQVWPRVVDDGA